MSMRRVQPISPAVGRQARAETETETETETGGIAPDPAQSPIAPRVTRCE